MSGITAELPSLPPRVADLGLDGRRAVYALWGVAVLAAVGDIVLTYYGLQLGLVERNPIARSMLYAYGFGALVFLKLPAFCLAILCSHLLAARLRFLAPLFLAAPWGLATIWNGMLILGTL